MKQKAYPSGKQDLNVTFDYLPNTTKILNDLQKNYWTHYAEANTKAIIRIQKAFRCYMRKRAAKVKFEDHRIEFYNEQVLKSKLFEEIRRR